MANRIAVPIINLRPPLPSPAPSVASPVSPRISAYLYSLDTGLKLDFEIPPSEHERNFGSNWEEAGVAQAAIQFIEYKDTPPEERTYRVCFDAYRRPGGIANDIEKQYQTLKNFTLRPDGKFRAHKLMYVQGVQRFRCVLKWVSMPVRRIAKTGGALQSLECSITLKELAT